MLEAWLTGTYRNGQLVLRSKTGERLTAAITNNTATGAFTLSGRTLRFSIAKAGRRVIIVAGVPLGTPGATNMLRIAFVGSEAAD